MSKRITGYVNWRVNRMATHQPEVLQKLLADLAERSPGHIAITGDLINLGLDGEIENARKWLDGIGKPDDVSLVCGNHDAYVPGALQKCLQHWQPFVTGDDGRFVYGAEDFPYVRRRGGISIIGCNSARATMPFMATGYFRASQASRLAQILEHEGAHGQCRVVLIHHPPVRGAAPGPGRLVGQSLFRKIIAAHGAELILHGHTHVDSIHKLAGKDRPVAVVGVPSGAQAPIAAMRKPAARYNLFNIEHKRDGWTIDLQEFGYAGPGSEVALVGQKRVL